MVITLLESGLWRVTCNLRGRYFVAYGDSRSSCFGDVSVWLSENWVV